MSLDELEKQIVALESEQTLTLVGNVLADIPQLKKNIDYVKLQLDNLE
jgi:hypothetical protein